MIRTCLSPQELEKLYTKFSVGDKIRIVEQLDPNHGLVGKIIRYDADDNSYLVEFEYNDVFGKGVSTDWYYGTSDFVGYGDPAPPPFPGESYCSHEWKEDKWFTSKIFKTCKYCGARHEDTIGFLLEEKKKKSV